MAMYKWTNHDGDVDWNNLNNWEPPGVPSDGDEVVIPDSDAQGHNLPNDGPAPPGIQLTALDLGKLGLIGGAGVTVTESLTWHGGSLDCDLVLTGDGIISGLDGSLWNPVVLNSHTVTVQGTLTIQGSPGGDGQSFIISTGGNLFNQGTINLVGAGLSVNAGFGTVDNSGTIGVSGTCLITGVTMSHNPGATIAIPAGSSLLVGADEGGDNATLRLCGGTVTAEGSLSVGNGVGGEIDIVADTSVANLTIGPNGWVAPEFGAGQPSPVLPGILTVTQSLTWSGPLPVGPGWFSNIGGHVVIPATATATVTNAVTLGNGRIDNQGHFTLAPGAALAADGVFNNNGTLTFSDTGGTTSGAITNTGLIEKTGQGTAALGSDLTNTGNIAIRAGTLQVSDANWTIGQGEIAMTGGNISQNGLGGITLAGGTTGGVLSGSGMVAAAFDNGGWIEPSGAGLTFSNQFTPHPDGNLLFPATVWTAADGQPLISIGLGKLFLAGSVWSLADGPPGAPVTRNLINVTAPWIGTFGRVRIKDDDTRLELTLPAAGAAGVATGQMTAAPAFYGLDFQRCPAPDAAGTHRMQQLFENTLLSFVAFYLGRSPANRTWSTYGAARLIGQGWALLPTYFGSQQEQNPPGEPRVNVIPAAVNAARAQGTTEGNDAVALAAGAALPQGSIIYKDLETSHRILQQTFAYIEAWATAVVHDGRYRPGVYCSGVQPQRQATPTCDTIRQHDQNQHNLAFWPFRLQGLRETWLAQGPVDANGDVRPLAFAQPPGSTGTWAFTGYANAWQFSQNWPTGPTRRHPHVIYQVIYTDTGDQLKLSDIYDEFDFDIGRTADPGNTVGGSRKTTRRRAVSSISANATSITSGSTATLTVTIDGPAAQPDGLIVLIRSSLPEAVVPTSVRVPAGQSETSVQFSGHVPAGQITATLSARALNQLTGAPVTTQVTVTPPA
jgi:hypothetical protein